MERGVSGSRTQSWADPILGARLRLQIAPGWSVIGYGDLGGFGAASRLTWQGMSTLNYEINERLWVSAGYRYMAVDSRRDGMILDVAMGGPLLALTWRF